VLALASSGGHWVQLSRILPGLLDHDLVVATVKREDVEQAGVQCRYRRILDATRWSKLRLIASALGVLWILLRERPDVILTTGAAPGYIALRLGKFLGARTIWLDSIANVEQISLSGRKAQGCADLWLTQWEHLAREGGPRYEGSVL